MAKPAESSGDKKAVTAAFGTPADPGLVGKSVTDAGHDNHECVCMKCLCLCDTDGTCLAMFHVRGGRACLAVPDGQGGMKHAFLDELLGGNVTTSGAREDEGEEGTQAGRQAGLQQKGRQDVRQEAARQESRLEKQEKRQDGDK